MSAQSRLPRKLQRLVLWAWAAGVVCTAEGCAHRPSTMPTAAPSFVAMDEVELTVSKRTGDFEAVDAPTLFEEGGAHMDADRFAAAAGKYDRLVQGFPDSAYVPPSLFNAGLSWEGEGKLSEAIDRYQRLVTQFPAHKLVKQAQLRLAACEAESARWVASIETLEHVLSRGDLTLEERIEGMARLGLGHYEIRNEAVAEQTFRTALAYFEAHQSEERLESKFFLAMAQFYEAYLGHQRFKALPLRLPQKQLAQDVETLAKQFTLSHDRYVKAIRIKDAFWATAAGYHVGALYRELYDTLIQAPLPIELDNELKKLVYAESLKGNLRTLLVKARGVLSANLDAAGRMGVKNGWVDRSAGQLDEIDRLLASLDDQPVGPRVKSPTQTAPPPPAISRPPALPQRPKRSQVDAVEPTAEPATDS